MPFPNAKNYKRQDLDRSSSNWSLVGFMPMYQDFLIMLMAGGLKNVQRLKRMVSRL